MLGMFGYLDVRMWDQTRSVLKPEVGLKPEVMRLNYQEILPFVISRGFLLSTPSFPVVYNLTFLLSTPSFLFSTFITNCSEYLLCILRAGYLSIQSLGNFMRHTWNSLRLCFELYLSPNELI